MSGSERKLESPFIIEPKRSLSLFFFSPKNEQKIEQRVGGVFSREQILT